MLAVQAVQSTGWQPPDANAALGVDTGSTGAAATGQPASSPVVLAGQHLAATPESTDPLPEQLDVAALVKAVGLDQLSKAAAAAPPAPACKPNNAGFGKVKAWVAAAGYEIRCAFGVSTVLGVGSRGEVSDHPLGLALDFMVNRTTGDALANFALQNMDRLSIKYVIWRQRINYGSGWQGMEDRGGVTANHYDHVHVSFDSKP